MVWMHSIPCHESSAQRDHLIIGNDKHSLFNALLSSTRYITFLWLLVLFIHVGCKHKVLPKRFHEFCDCIYVETVERSVLCCEEESVFIWIQNYAWILPLFVRCFSSNQIASFSNIFSFHVFSSNILSFCVIRRDNLMRLCKCNLT